MTTLYTPKPLVLVTTPLSDIEAEDVDFFWNPYVPVGALTLMYGYGGIGKSWITCALAADASTGRAFPGHVEQVPPQKVLIVSAEDDARYVLKPRMERLGADMRNVFVIEQPFLLDNRGTEALKRAMEKVEATFVILDPLVAFLGGQMDINKSNEARAITKPLADAAADTGSAVIVVHHERKGNQGRTANRAMGSADFINGVRSALHVGESKDGQKFMAHPKHNWSKEGPTLQFTIDDDVFRWSGQYKAVPRGLTDPDLPVFKAREFLRASLAEGEKPASIVILEANEAGVLKSTLNRAKIGVVQVENRGGVWWWTLQRPAPTQSPTPDDILARLGRGPSPATGPSPSQFAPGGV